MLQSYNEKLKQAHLRRARALARVRLAQLQASGAIEQKTQSLKQDYRQKVEDTLAQFKPSNIVRQHPWGAALFMVGVGMLLVPLVKWIFGGRRAASTPAPQPVTVTTAGAPKVHKASLSRAFDAMLSLAPGLIGLAQHFGKGPFAAERNGHRSAEPASAEDPAPAQHTSISRRTAPPPL